MEDWLIGLVKIILINIVLSGDNAVVIALACRSLPAERQKQAIFWGSFGAVGLRIVLTFVAVWMLAIPFVELAGGLLLLYIAVKLLKGEEEEGHIKASASIGVAIRTIIIADFIMSLDNVLAVAGAASGNIWLILIGLAISIPLIIVGSSLLMRIMNRFPIIIWIGAAVLGYTSGEMALSDHAVSDWVDSKLTYAHQIIPYSCAFLVVVAGKLLELWHRKQRRSTVTAPTP